MSSFSTSFFQPFKILLLLIGFNANSTVNAQITRSDSLKIDSFPSIPFLPNPLILNEGGKNIPVVNYKQWQQKRDWIRKQYEHWISGSVPPAPKTFHSKILSESIQNGVKDQMIEVTFGPGGSAKMTFELMIPLSGKPLPVFMTQWSHRAWAQVAVRRGYIGCVYAGSDSKDDTRNYSEVYPDYDFATLMKRAWGASRVIDYLYTIPKVVDTARIAITGHSRNGKQSVMAAAFDKRIKAVVSSSGGTGAESTFRYSDERFSSESLENITRNFPHWFDSRLRLFTGREQKLPVDQNSLMSLIAPRGLMIVSSITEEQGNPWGIEHSYKSVKKVYHFLHADSKVAILLRRGRHQHSARNVETYLDFFDYVFGRSKIAPENRLYYDYSFEKWKKQSGEEINPLKFPQINDGSLFEFASIAPGSRQDSLRNRIHWLLGTPPPGTHADKVFSSNINRNHSYPDDYLAEVIGIQPLPDEIRKMVIASIGDDLWANIYFPADSVIKNQVSGKLPLVIFLHDYSYATGSHRNIVQIVRHFTDKGFAVLTFDMVGFGTRVEEALHFYDRYPHWSLLGKMVTDTRSIINDVCNQMPFIDSSNIFLAGYSLGGTVALFTAAIDNHVKGVAVVSAFSSLRNDNIGTEGIRHYSDLHLLIPRLGFFIGHENRIPIDFQDILAGISGRSLMIVAPELDRHHSIKSVNKIVTAVSPKFEEAKKLTFLQPETYNHFPLSVQKEIAYWLSEQKEENNIKK
jgi:cephalosporin-C deacetylase-like acetyl esterase